MIASKICQVGLVVLSAISVAFAQSSNEGYTGYNLGIRDEEDSVIYETASTPANGVITDPDVYLNASVHVGEIDITVQNLTAKINLAAQVLQLLQFNAGVDLSINRVALTIQNVTAKVLLEARLENLVSMINDTLSSIDLNPIIATLGQDVGQLVGAVGSGLSGAASQSSTVVARSFDLDNNILYAVNDYSGNTHTNRILTQTGSIIEQSLDNNGNVHSETTVGSYATNMSFNGYNESAVRNGRVVRETEYVYSPFSGLSVVCAVFMDEAGAVVATQVLSESSGGGSSSVGGGEL